MKILFILLLLASSFVVGDSLQVARAGDGGDFPLWLSNFKAEALQAGITKETLDVALSRVKPLDWIITLDRSQPEFTKTLDQYLAGTVSAQRVKKGRRLLLANRAMFSRIADKYGVQPRFLIALWGIETSFGQHTGKVPVVDALVTLAYDGRRSQYFRSELLNALEIIDQGHITYEKMVGSWAGAMGQVQFMPSSFLRYAVDGNGDGRIDLWNSREDYLSSAANYLARAGWNGRYTWGREVMVPKTLSSDCFGLDHQRTLSAWQTLGVRTMEKENLPESSIDAALIRPDGSQGRSFLVYGNYRVLLTWNRAHRFALAVGILADRIGGR